jgi:glutamyl-tRNA reductase
MKLLLTGLSHRTAPVEVRERLAVPAPALGSALTELRATVQADEALILSTCNRVEIAVTAPDQAPATIRDFLARRSQSSADALGSYLYELAWRDAIRHIFRVEIGRAQV